MTTQRNPTTVPRIQSAASFVPRDVRRAVLELLGPSTLVTRTLRATWDAPSVFVVSVFSDASFEWVSKSIAASEKGRRVVLLLPADAETVGGQLALRKCRSVLFVSGKQIAGRSTTLVGFGVDLSPVGWLGIVLSPFRGNP